MKPRIALFQNHPECSRQCVNGMIEALAKDYKLIICSEEFFTKENLKEVDMVAFPGGIGEADSYYDFFKRRHGNAVAEFIEDGGHYLGICMGAYWAGKDYFDILQGIDPVQYIKRDTADIRRPYGTVAEIDWLDEKEHMFFYDGCALIGDKDEPGTISNVYGRYANGDPMAVIQGRIGLIGCHLESEKYWYAGKYNYLKKYWHEGKHHKLLLDFVDEIIWKVGRVV